MAQQEALPFRKLHVIADYLRGYAARCAEAALPFRKLRDFFMGLRPSGLALWKIIILRSGSPLFT